MKFKFKMSIFCTILGLGLGLHSLPTFAQKKDLVKNANEAFLAGKYPKAISRIKEILIDGDEMEKEEAFKLLNTMYLKNSSEGNGNKSSIIKPDWEFPYREMENLRISVQTVKKNDLNSTTSDLRYYIKVSGVLSKGTVVENFQLKYISKNTKDTLIDLKQQKGEFYEEVPGEFYYKTKKSSDFFKFGVYRFEFHFKNKSKFAGWVIIDPQMVCDTLPEITAISAQSISWNAYKINKNNTYDIKSILASLKTNGSNNDTDLWENKYSDINITTAKIELKNGPLEGGEYKGTVNVRERRHFSSIEIGRECMVSKAFSILK